MGAAEAGEQRQSLQGAVGAPREAKESLAVMQGAVGYPLILEAVMMRKSR